jgi:ketosteroid isomerase-like protein
MTRIAILTLGVCLAACRPTSAPAPSSPAAVAQSVLDADRAYARAAAAQAYPAAVAALLTDGALMPAPRGELLEGRTRIQAALAATADSTASATWTPIEVGLSADGQHAFTVGFVVTTRADGTRAQFKYLAYWVRGANGWRAAAWRRRPMDAVPIDSALLPALLPERLVAVDPSPERAVTQRAELRAAEAEFSALANRIGVGAAFAQRGVAASLNVGAPGEGRFTRGADAIARAVSGGQPLDAPSTIVWSADTALVASSGDLGITFGVIRPKAAPPGAPATGASFFTIWQKISGTWRYVAE